MATSNLSRHPPPVVCGTGWHRWWMWLAIALPVAALAVVVTVVVERLRG